MTSPEDEPGDDLHPAAADLPLDDPPADEGDGGVGAPGADDAEVEL